MVSGKQNVDITTLSPTNLSRSKFVCEILVGDLAQKEFINKTRQQNFF
jgi:hypothetical protein